MERGKVHTTKLLSQGYQKTKLVLTLKKFYGRHHDLVNPYNVSVSRIISEVFASDAPYVDFPNPGHTLLPIFPSFRPVGMVGEACLPSNVYYPRMPDYTLYSWVHVCWSEHSYSSFVYGFMSLDYGLGTMTATTFLSYSPLKKYGCNLVGKISQKLLKLEPWNLISRSVVMSWRPD